MPTPSLYRALSFLEGLREIEPEMYVHTAQVLLRVAAKPAFYQRDLQKLVSLSQSAAARQVDKLGDREGLGLITARATLTSLVRMGFASSRDGKSYQLRRAA